MKKYMRSVVVAGLVAGFTMALHGEGDEVSVTTNDAKEVTIYVPSGTKYSYPEVLSSAVTKLTKTGAGECSLGTDAKVYGNFSGDIDVQAGRLSGKMNNFGANGSFTSTCRNNSSMIIANGADVVITDTTSDTGSGLTRILARNLTVGGSGTDGNGAVQRTNCGGNTWHSVFVNVTLTRDTKLAGGRWGFQGGTFDMKNYNLTINFTSFFELYPTMTIKNCGDFIVERGTIFVQGAGVTFEDSAKNKSVIFNNATNGAVYAFSGSTFTGNYAFKHNIDLKAGSATLYSHAASSSIPSLLTGDVYVRDSSATLNVYAEREANSNYSDGYYYYAIGLTGGIDSAGTINIPNNYGYVSITGDKARATRMFKHQGGLLQLKDAGCFSITNAGDALIVGYSSALTAMDIDNTVIALSMDPVGKTVISGGRITLNSGAMTNNMNIGSSSWAQFYQKGGTVRYMKGSADNIIGNGTAGQGHVYQTGGTADAQNFKNSQNTAGTTSISLGTGSGCGTYTINGGSFIGSGGIYVGGSANTYAAITALGNGSFNGNGNIYMNAPSGNARQALASVSGANAVLRAWCFSCSGNGGGVLSAANGGTIQVQSRIAPNGSSTSMYVNFDNGILNRVDYGGHVFRWEDSGDKANYKPKRVTIYKGGVKVVVPVGKTTMLDMPLERPSGRGIKSITLPDEVSNDANYLGPAKLLPSGSGNASSAVCDYDPETRKVTGITLYSPGIDCDETTKYEVYSSNLKTKYECTIELTEETQESGGLTKTGSGVLQLVVAGNSYGGATTVSEGTLELTGDGDLPSGNDLVIAAGATMNVGSKAVTVNSLSGGGTLNGTGTVTVSNYVVSATSPSTCLTANAPIAFADDATFTIAGVEDYDATDYTAHTVLNAKGGFTGMPALSQELANYFKLYKSGNTLVLKRRRGLVIMIN